MGPMYGSSSSLGTSHHQRGNAIPLTIPRNVPREGGSNEHRPSWDSLRESTDFSRGRFHSPSRYSGQYGSHSRESVSPFSLRRPSRQKDSSKTAAEPPVITRTEGFETTASFSSFGLAQEFERSPRKEGVEPAHPISLSASSSGLSCSPPQTPETAEPSQRPEPVNFKSKVSEPRPAGLLSRTFSSKHSNPEALKLVQEKLEHCLGSRPSIGQDIDGESISHLRRLAEQHDIFKAPAVSVAYNVAKISYSDNERGRRIMRQCVESACVLAELGADETIVSAALLKDVLSQSMMTEQQLRPLVLPAVFDLVQKVAKLEDICKVRQDMVRAAQNGLLDEEASQKINRLLMTLADYKGVLVKLADRVTDLQRAVKTQSEHARESATEALELFAPMANRLGVWSLKARLEDLAFQVLHPAEHAELHSKLRESQDRGAIEGALDTLSDALHGTDVKGVDLSGRPKNLFGVMKKMHAKKKSIDQVYDVRALRVIVQSKNDCYAVLREAHKLWPEIQGSFKDYVRFPKENGYRSIHTVVRLPDGQPMEIQIRTDKMHFIAEYGIAAHWRYKEQTSKTICQAEEQQVNWARWLISWSLELRDAKCRPRGSPPNDSTFAKLANSICKFPSHGDKCEFAAWASKSLPQPVSEEVLAEQPPMIVFLDHTNEEALPITSIQEVPPQSTVDDLASVLAYPPGSQVLINTLEATDGSQVLEHGDRVEVFAAPKVAQRLSKVELNYQREKLKRLFAHSPSAHAEASRIGALKIC